MNRWRPIVGGLCLNLAFGSLYAWSVFVLPLEHEFGWTRAQTSWVYTIAIIVTVLATLIGGRLQDRRGPLISVLVGGGLMASGYFLCSLVGSLPQLYAAYAIGAFGAGCGYAAPMPVASKWFPDRRGFILGVLAGGYAAGSAIIGPLAEALIDGSGWRMTFRLLAAVFLGTTAVGAVLLRNPPDDYRRGEIAGGGRQRDVDAPPSAALVARPDFRLLWAAFAFGSLSGQMVISQLVPFARSVGLGTLASLAIPIAAAGNVSGRVISGWISDRAGRLTTLQIMVVGSAFAMTGLFVWREQPLLFFVFVAAVYWCYGTQMSVFASTTADFFGTSHLGMNWGLMLSAWGVAGVVGPIAAAWTFDRFHSYQYAFIAAAALAIVASAILAWVRTLRGQPAISLDPLASTATRRG